MPSKLRMEFLSEGFKAVLTGDGVRSKVDAMAKAVAQEAGEGFEPGVFLATYGGSPRHIGTVRAATREARKAEAKEQALTRSIGAARSV